MCGQQREEALADMLGIEIEDRPVAAEDEDSGDALVFRMTDGVREIVRPRHLPEFGAARPHRPPEQEQQREDRAEEHSHQQARPQHAEESHHRHRELALAEGKRAFQGSKVEKAGHRGEHDGGEHRLRQMAEEA